MGEDTARRGRGTAASGWMLAGLGTVAAWVLFAWPWLVQGHVIPWDAKDYYYPVLRALAAARHAGDAGFWNPYLYAGASAVADPQSWLFVPGFRLLAELVPEPSMRLVDAVQLMHLLFGGLGLVALGRTFGWRPAAAVLAAIVFMGGGVAAARLQHSLMTVSYAWLPWAMLALHLAFAGTCRARRVAAAAAFGLVAGIMAVGRDQVAFLNCLFLIACCAGWLAATARSQGWRTALDRIVGLIPALLVGGAVLAVPMLLTLDVLDDSTRPEIAFATAAYAALHPASLLTLLAPNAFGALTPDAYWGSGTLPWMGLSALGNDWNDRTTSHLYVGLVPLALLAATLAGGWRPLPRGARTAALGLVLALAYALGPYTPLFRAIYELVPGVDLYRRPNDAAFLLNAMLALLTGLAADRLGTPALRVGLAAAALAVCGMAAGLWLGWRLGHLADMAVALSVAVPLFGLAVLLVVRIGPQRHGLALLAALTACDLAWHGTGRTLNAVPADAIAAYRPEGTALADAIRARLGGGPAPDRVEIFGLDRVPGADDGGSWQNAAMAYGLEQTLGYDPLLPADYARAMGAEQNSHLPERQRTALFTGYDSPLARLLGIGLVVTGRPIESILPAEATRSLELVERHPGAWIYANAGALPRALAVGRAEPDTGGPLPTDPTAVVLVEGLTDAAGIAGAAGEARIELRRREEVRVTARMEREGFLLLADRYDPSWRATVGGRAVPVLRANRIFRAVPVPAGTHEVVFRFEPLRAGALAEALRRVAAP